MDGPRPSSSCGSRSDPEPGPRPGPDVVVYPDRGHSPDQHGERMTVGASSVPKAGFVVDQPGGNVALDLFVLDQHLGTALDSALAGVGVTASLYAVYSQLDQGALTPRRLCDLLGIRPTTLSGYLATMQRAGHVTRVRNERDGRSWVLELTDAGRAKVAECRPVMRRVVGAIEAAIGSPDEVRGARAARRRRGRCPRRRPRHRPRHRARHRLRSGAEEPEVAVSGYYGACSDPVDAALPR